MATLVRVNNLDIADQGADPGEWAVTHAPTANTKATITQAAPGAGKRNVIKSFYATLCSDGTAPTATTATLNVIDGDTGGTPLFTVTMAIQAAAGAFNPITMTDLNIECTANGKTTIEFTAAAGAHTLESVGMSGHIRNVQQALPS